MFGRPLRVIFRAVSQQAISDERHPGAMLEDGASVVVSTLEAEMVLVNVAELPVAA